MVRATGGIIFVLLAAAGLYLVGNARICLWDRDEPRYAMCSRQMLQSGDWVVPRLYDDLRAAKPPLVYWCQAASMRIFGEEGDRGAFAARFPSSLAMLCTLVILAIVIYRHVCVSRAFWTILVFASSGLVIMTAKVCLTDSVLLLWVVIAQICLYRIWRGDRSWRTVLILAAALGLGGLTKGPFIVGVVGMTALMLIVFHLVGAYWRRGRQPTESEEAETKSPRDPARIFTTLTKALAGAAIVVAIVGPWLYLVHQRAPDFLVRALHQARGHMSSGLEGHAGPPGYHTALVWGTFLPWSVLLPLALGIGISNRREPTVRFALAAVLGAWLVIEFFIKTKLPHYELSAFPALAYLVAFAIEHCLQQAPHEFNSRGFGFGINVWGVVMVAAGVMPWFAVRRFSSLPWGAMSVLLVATILYAGSVILLFHRRRPRLALLTMGGGAMICAAIGAGWFFPRAGYLRTSIDVAAVLRREGAVHVGDVYMIDYKEPSVGFYQGGTIRERTSRFLVPRFQPEWPQWLVITSDVWKKAMPEVHQTYQEIHRTRGWSYADDLRVVEVIVLRKRESAGKQ